MQASEYSSYDGLGLAELVRTNQVSAPELAAAALAAIDRLNPEINAVIGTLEDEMKASLARVPECQGPFVGVPFLIKDIVLHYANVPSEMGSRFARGFVLPHDTELAARFKRTGVVTIGRTNTPELGLNISTEPVANGPTCNPWNTNLSSGGSSGGAAAAVAAGIVPLAHGNDGGGSIRVPAALCGLFGLKPSRARSPFGPDVDEGILGLGNEHVLTRSVRDCAAMLDAVAGPDVGARIMLPPPDRPWLESASSDPAPLRMVFSTSSFPGGPKVHPDCVAAVERAVQLCHDLGHHVEEGTPLIDHQMACDVFLNLAGLLFSTMVDEVAALTGNTPGSDNMESATLACLEYGTSLSASDVAATFNKINVIARTSGRFFETCDVWISPVAAQPPWKLGMMNANKPGIGAVEWVNFLFDYAPFTAAFNVTGQPAMSMPLHRNADGLPIGVQFVGHLGDETTLFSLAGQLERAAPWFDLHPPIFND